MKRKLNCLRFSANIDSVCRRSVVERIRICMRFVFQHRRCAWKHIFCDQVFPDNHDHNTCRSDIFLYASIDHSIFCDIYRLREETGRNVCNQRLSFCIRQFFKFCSVNRIASSADKTFSYIPDCSDLPVSEDADYVYICENNTIYGTKFKELPNTKGKTLVADVSSCFLSEPVDVKNME